MESWQVDLLKIGATAIIFFLIGVGSHWFRSRSRFKYYLRKRGIEKVSERETLQETEKLTSLLIEHKKHSITVEELHEFREKMFSQASEDKLEARSLEGISDTKEEFLRRAYGYRVRAYTLLYMAMAFQIALTEHRVFEPTDLVEGNTMDEKTRNILKKILDKGLEVLFPIGLIDEKSGEIRSVYNQELVENLQLIDKLILLSQKIEKGELGLPPRLDIDSLFDKVADALTTVAVSLEVVGTHSILHSYRIMKSIEALKREMEQSDAEQRPLRFPPPNSD